MPRRDAFSRLRSEIPDAPSVNQSVPGSVSGKQDLPPAVRPLDLIPAAEPRKKRERKWEKEHRAEIATYRGIPAETHQILLQLADTLSVPVDEVARALLEYSLYQYRAGSLPLHPYPKSQRMTLFPDGNQVQDLTSNNPWLQQAFVARKLDRKKKKGKEPKKWESRVTYRLPPELKTEVKEIADSHFVGVGELVLYLFLNALNAVNAQLLRFEVHPKVSGNTLF